MLLHSVNFLGQFSWCIDTWRTSHSASPATLSKVAFCLCYICFTFVLHLFYICFTFVLHLFYICDGKEDLSILVHSLVGLNGCEWMERGENIDFRDKKLF